MSVPKHLKEESGYSLVEVMVAIIIMALAILPMVGMFDMALRSTTEGSKYDKARMLANLKLEQAKNLPFDSLDDTIQDVKDNFPEDAGTVTAYDAGPGKYVTDPPKTEPGFPNFTYVVEKQYMAQPSQEPGGLSENWGTCETNGTCETGTNLIRVTVTVRWDDDNVDDNNVDDDNTFTTYGLVAGS